MFQKLRRHLSYANVAATLAVVFAMSGGAYAVSGQRGSGGSGGSGSGGASSASARALLARTGLGVSHATVAKKKKAAGVRGPMGPTGPAGANGAKGENGVNGSNGTNGTSATTTAFTGKEHGCKEGGVLVESASPEAAVCNGEKGKNGTTGFTETLPPNQTETGTWSMQGRGEVFEPISFPIQVEGTIVPHYIDKHEAPPAGCAGSALAPAAEPGNLCVFEGEEGVPFVTEKVKFRLPADLDNSTVEVGKTGTIMIGEPGEGIFGAGDWAVTAPTE
jgi:hypothetical protein